MLLLVTFYVGIGPLIVDALASKISVLLESESTEGIELLEGVIMLVSPYCQVLFYLLNNFLGKRKKNLFEL